MKKIVIVVPTYNERDNIKQLVEGVFAQKKKILKDYALNILVVDDTSPDGTAEVVKKLQSKYKKQLSLLMGKKQGLGKAYIRGFEFAMRELEADVVFQMDADLSHDPRLIGKMVKKIDEGYDFVIGSRYVPGGAIPSGWPWLRKMNSRWGNIFAQYVAGLNEVRDCTGGFRAIRVSLLKKIDLRNLKASGYVFQISLLAAAMKRGAAFAEVPLVFVDREKGSSKLRVEDVIEFVERCIGLWWERWRLRLLLVVGVWAGWSLVAYVYEFGLMDESIMVRMMSWLMLAMSLLMGIQALFTLYWMLYAWEDPDTAAESAAPGEYVNPRYSFTAVIPALHEATVIENTIRAVAMINYPERLKEIIVVNREDDEETIEVVKKTIKKLKKSSIRLLIKNRHTKNKPEKLNYALGEAKGDVVVVFDAEDEPHQELYKVVNTVMVDRGADVVQGGVQLMNYRSRWFSLMNVLEYFFWFKSALHYFAKQGVIPLGGNTVFFKRDWLKKVGGWNETCLTEDAEVGIRLSSEGAKVVVMYDEQFVTQEETPHSVESFIKQRTRWHQGFVQILRGNSWLYMPSLRQRLLALYILLSPLILALLLLYTPVALMIGLMQPVPVVVSLVSYIPLILMLLVVVTNMFGIWEFVRIYYHKRDYLAPLLVLVTFVPYVVLLAISAVRALYRSVQGAGGWEKTVHLNAHRRLRQSLLRN